MLFGISVQGPYPPGAPRDRQYATVQTAALAAKRHGFDFLTVNHSYLHPGPITYGLSPLPLLARLSADVPGMRLMTGVYLVPLDHPLRIANDMATVDVISGGMLDIGMGLAYRQEEFDNLGVNIKTRGTRFDESIDVMRRLFTEEKVDHKGKHFQLTGARLHTLPIQQPHPPFWIGGYSDVAVRRAAERGDGWYPGAFGELGVLQRQVELYRKTLKAAGKPGNGQLAVLRFTWIDEDREKAREAAKAHSQSANRGYVGTGLRESLPEYRNRPWLQREQLFEENWCAGNPDDIIQQVTTYIKLLNPDRFNFRVAVDPSSHSAATKAIELLGKKVLPRLRALAKKA